MAVAKGGEATRRVVRRTAPYAGQGIRTAVFFLVSRITRLIFPIENV